LKADY